MQMPMQDPSIHRPMRVNEEIRKQTTAIKISKHVKFEDKDSCVMYCG